MLVWKSRVPVSVGSRQWRLMKSTVARSRTGKPDDSFTSTETTLPASSPLKHQNDRALLAGLQGDGRIRRFGPFAARAGVVERTNVHRGRLRRGGERGGHDERAGGWNAKVDVRRVRQGDEDARLIVLLRLLRLLGDCLRRQHRRLDDDGNFFPDGRDRFDGNDALPRAENSNQQKKDANRIHPGEFAFRLAAGRRTGTTAPVRLSTRSRAKIRFASMMFIGE